MAIRIIPATAFRQGRWLNGMGVSWDIAAEPPGATAAEFGWRFAIARIDADVPFSAYADVDRVFTLIEGEGLDLDVEGTGRIAVHELNVPKRFPGDAPTMCTLRGGPCRALNLFLARDTWRAEVEVMRIAHASDMGHGGTSLFLALEGNVAIDGARLACGDAAMARGRHAVAATDKSALLYAARLHRRD